MKIVQTEKQGGKRRANNSFYAQKKGSKERVRRGCGFRKDLRDRNNRPREKAKAQPRQRRAQTGTEY